jgi:hypothetical protein
MSRSWKGHAKIVGNVVPRLLAVGTFSSGRTGPGPLKPSHYGEILAISVAKLTTQESTLDLADPSPSPLPDGERVSETDRRSTLKGVIAKATEPDQKWNR